MDEGPKQVHQASNQIKEKQNKLSSTHLVTAIACNKRLGVKNITDISTLPV